MNRPITQPNPAWIQSSSIFKRRGNDSSITVFTEGDKKQSIKLTKLLSSMLLGTGVAVASVMSLGDADIVIKECKTNNLPENIIYAINDTKQHYGIHNLVSIPKLEHIKKNSTEWNYLKHIIMVKEYLRKNNGNCYLLQELDYFRENFPSGWNGENSMPLDSKVYENVYHITSKFNKKLENWSLVLRTNGSVSMMSDDDRASIDIAREHISFCITTRDNKHLVQRHLKFELTTIDKIIELWQHTA